MRTAAMSQPPSRWSNYLLVLWLVLMSSILSADEPKSLTVRDVSFLLQVGADGRLNQSEKIGTGLPVGVASRRPRLLGKLSEASQAVPQPLGIITFEGSAATDCEASLQLISGKHFAHLPPAEVRNTRILWPTFDLVKSPPATQTSALGEPHWLSPLKQGNRLTVSHDTHAESFLLYDLSLKRTHQLSIVTAEDGYRVVVTGKSEVHDVTVFRPMGDGQWMVAHVDVITPNNPPSKSKGGKTNETETIEEVAIPSRDVPVPAETPKTLNPNLDQPEDLVVPPTVTEADLPIKDLEPIDDGVPGLNAGEDDAPPNTETGRDDGTLVPYLTKKSVTATEAAEVLTQRLEPLGLGDVEVAYVARMLQALAITPEQTVVVYRLDAGDYEELLPLEVIPTPTRLVRVPLVIVYGQDPHVLGEVDALIAQLGDPSWKAREAAQARLLEIGKACAPKLTKALDHSDLELVMRVEQLLEVLEKSNDTPANEFLGPGLFF
ncbi:MAG: hypothetical protein R3C01_09360 [Planctomycetaceae bacterium]